MMKRSFRLTALLTALLLAAASAVPAAAAEKKILRAAASFAYSSLDAHKQYYGWYTSIYGITESLFRMADDASVQPWLAESCSADESGLTWTIRLRKNVCFSNGKALTAEMVVRNLLRAAELNTRCAYLKDFKIQTIDQRTLSITAPRPYPTLLNGLAGTELGIMDLDGTKDFDNAPVGTGPFVVEKFVPEGDVTVSRNPHYWKGSVALDGAVFYYMQDDNSKLLAMQNGEIDCYNSVSTAALEVYRRSPDRYRVVSIPGMRLQFYILNENRLSPALRRAINLTVDKKAMAAFLAGTVSPASGPFGADTAYGKVKIPAADPAAARAILEADGCVLNARGMYEKDGKPPSVEICYYAARSLDVLATLMAEQLKNVGIASTLRVEEDPDSTYIANGDYDVAMYCMIADKAGDPYGFINATMSEGAFYNTGGFKNADVQEMIEQMRYEPDTTVRADLANRIVQIAVDDNAFGYVGLFNKTTVLRTGVSGFAENNPFDFYGIGADTDIK